MKITAIYPGTFDPVTNGHLDIIHRACKLFDRLIVAVADGSNANKSTLFSQIERQQMLSQSIDELKLSETIEVITFDQLLVDICQQYKAQVILRGLRAVSDFEYEFQLAGMNKQLNQQVETLFLPTSEKFSYISSSLVKQVARLGGDIGSFVPNKIRAELLNKLV